jgi:hypothetical protein
MIKNKKHYSTTIGPYNQGYKDFLNGVRVAPFLQNIQAFFEFNQKNSYKSAISTLVKNKSMFIRLEEIDETDSLFRVYVLKNALEVVAYGVKLFSKEWFSVCVDLWFLESDTLVKVKVTESAIFNSSQQPKLETIVLVVEHLILRLRAHSSSEQRKIIGITIMVDAYDFDN